MNQHRHIYGPVPSRRLGRSLGVDLLPFKTCTYDCAYCQLGHTTNHTMQRREYVPVDEVLSELAEHLEHDRPDVISFAGSGEPTLHSGLGRCIEGIKAMTDVPTAVITNGSLLWMPEVRRDLAKADMVNPSLDVALPCTARTVNMLAPGLRLRDVLSGLVTFCAEYTGRIWLEIMLAKGMNDSDEDLEALNEVLARLEHVERVQLNTVTRPPADKNVLALSADELKSVQAKLCRESEIIASFPKGAAAASTNDITKDDVLALVSCHPSTVQGLSAGLNADEAKVRQYVMELKNEGRIAAEEREGEKYWVCPV